MNKPISHKHEQSRLATTSTSLDYFSSLKIPLWRYLYCNLSQITYLSRFSEILGPPQPLPLLVIQFTGLVCGRVIFAGDFKKLLKLSRHRSETMPYTRNIDKDFQAGISVMHWFISKPLRTYWLWSQGTWNLATFPSR